MKQWKLLIVLLLALILDNTAIAQISDPRETAKRKTEDRANQKTDEAVDKGLDKIEEGISNILKKKNKTKSSSSNTTAKNSSKTSGKPITNDSDVTDFSQYEGSSFMPGKDLLFFEDFSSAKLGSGNGNWFISDWDKENPGYITPLEGTSNNWLKITRYGIFYPNDFKSLPENCTIEFDMYMNAETVSEMQSGLRFSFVAMEDRENFNLHFNENPEVTLDIHPSGEEGAIKLSGMRQYGLPEEKKIFFEKNAKNAWKPNDINHVAIARNSMAIQFFLNGKEYASITNAFLEKKNYNFMMSSNQWGNGIYLTNIRVGGNAPNAMHEIKSEGKFVTNTIYFDVNSARIRPESWATLNNAAQAIKSTAGTVLILGHTDSDGTDQANLILSQKRAASVKAVLVKEFGIPDSRLATDGKGEGEPVESNNTASGKAQNRRVEFIQQ